MPDDTPTEPAPTEAPRGFLEKIGPAVAIGLTAVAAVFGSMSAGALQQAMYWKSQAAQDQSKATNQWSYAGFKRDRALVMQTSAAQLRAVAQYASNNFSASSLPPIKVKDDGPNTEQKRKDLMEAQARALEWLQKKTVPDSPLPKVTDEHIEALQKAIESREPEHELITLAGKVKLESINKALDDAEKKSAQYDGEWTPILGAAAQIAGFAGSGKVDAAIRTANQSAGYDLEERRYRAESRMNQQIASLYEVRVKVSSATSDRYRKKSEFLSYAMLVAQIGAVAASLALARKRSGGLWLIAAVIGFIALGFGGFALVPPGLIPI